DAALDERAQLHSDLQVGINAAGASDPVFWERLAAVLGADLLSGLDYVGLDAFPDVFRPIPLHQLSDAVAGLVKRFRAALSEIGIPVSTPIHITETGWPTDDTHDETTQATVLERVAHAFLNAGANVTGSTAGRPSIGPPLR